MPIRQKAKWNLDKTLLLLSFLIFFSISIFRGAKDLNVVLWTDSEGYYRYLTCLFIDHDFHHIRPRSMPYYLNEKGEVMIKYNYGVACFYLPFFLIANTIAQKLLINPTGLEDIYVWAIILAGVAWTVLAIHFLVTVLRRYFSSATTWLTVGCIVLGTNYFHYATRLMGMSHIYSFAAFALAVLVTDNYYRKPALWRAALVGLVFGWVFVTRPFNGFMILFLLLFMVASKKDFMERLSLFRMNYKHILFALPFFLAVQVPQLLYWKEMTGKWMVYSYKVETFCNWKDPYLLAVLFDTQNGLFLYTPVLLFSMIGLFISRKDPRANVISTSIIFITITYLYASWWAWWFGAAMGHRAYIDYYPLFAFPMAVVMEKILGLKNTLLKILILAVAVFFCYYNIRLSFLYDYYMIFWDGPEWRWNIDKWFQLFKKLFDYS
jgi:hypothetical protein